MYAPDSLVPTTYEFTDIAGLVKGASSGEGLGNKFLSHIRNVDAIVEVVRCFEDKNIIHVEKIDLRHNYTYDALIKNILAVKRNNKGYDHDNII